MTVEATLETWIKSDSLRYSALVAASKLNLPDWCLSAGFLRNLAWDKLHNKKQPTPLNDLDLIYFDNENNDPNFDKECEHALKVKMPLPWSVKNQARMHLRNMDSPYSSTLDAMSYWVEIETAVGVSLDQNNNMRFIAPFGLNSLFDGTITINSKRRKPEIFSTRLNSKNWLENWPQLKVKT